MKIQIVSDMHMDHKLNKEFYNEVIPCADILVIAGDLCPLRHSIINKEFIDWTKGKWKKVIRVTGNHEYWGGMITNDQIYDTDGSFITLSHGTIKYGDVTFICATGWGNLTSSNQLKKGSKPSFIDFSQIYGMDYNMFNEMGKRHRKFIMDTVRKTEGKIVIVSHHMPSFDLIDPMYLSYTDSNLFFAMDYNKFLDKYSDKIDCWIYGHSHAFRDEIVNGVRTIRNPYGYPHEREYSEDLYSPNFTIEV